MKRLPYEAIPYETIALCDGYLMDKSLCIEILMYLMPYEIGTLWDYEKTL